MQFLSNLGLEKMDNEQTILRIVQTTVEEGKLFPSYRGVYFHRNSGWIEFVVHAEQNIDGNGYSIIGFTTHVSGNEFWHVKISENEVFEEDTDLMSKCVFCEGVNVETNQIPIRISMADVIPAYNQGTELTLQMVGYPMWIKYYENEQQWREKNNWRIMGDSIILANGHFLSFGTDDTCMIKAKVKSVESLFPEAESFPDKTYRVMLETELGDLPLVHTVNMVNEEERKFIKPGCCVYASCCLQGDVAIGEYQQGAKFDQKHLYKLLQWELMHGDGTRLIKALTDDAKYISFEKGVMANGSHELIAHIKGISEGLQKEEIPTYAYTGRITGFIGEPKLEELPKGTDIIAIAYGSSARFGALMTLEYDNKGKIKAIKSCKNLNHSFNIDLPYAIKFDEYYELNVFKYCYDNQDLAACVNFFNWNAVLTHEDRQVAKHVLNVLYTISELFVAIEENGGNPNTYLVETTRDDSIPQRKCVALSAGELEKADSLLFLNLDEDNQVKEVMIKNASYHHFTEIKGIEAFEVERFIPENVLENVGETEDEWLKILLKWAEEDVRANWKVWSGICPDCTYEYTGPNTNHTLNDKNEIFAALRVLVNTPCENCRRKIVKDINGHSCLVFDEIVIHIIINEDGKIKAIFVNGPM